MQIVRLDGTADPPWPRPAVAVGNFDGVHRGHQALADAVRQEAEAFGGAAVVLTFDPHPARVLSPDRAPATVMNLDQKAEALEALGVAGLAVAPFTRDLADKSPAEFARLILGESLRASVVAVGASFRFGRGRAGGVATLESLGAALGFQVRIVEPVVHNGRPISSSRVRHALAEGDVDEARALLGRPYFLDASVVRGDGRGRTLGIPTANLTLANEALLRPGVYACRVRPSGGRGRFPGVMNVGLRPTFAGAGPSVEVHLLDFEGDLYGRGLRVELIARLRGEQAFSGPPELVAQIRRDIGEARARLERAREDGV